MANDLIQEIMEKVENACYYWSSEYINSKDAMAYRDGLVAGRQQALEVIWSCDE